MHKHHRRSYVSRSENVKKLQFEILGAEQKIRYLLHKCDVIDNRLSGMTEKVREFGNMPNSSTDDTVIPFTQPQIIHMSSERQSPLGTNYY